METPGLWLKLLQREAGRRQMGEKAAGLRLVAEGELPRCREFGRKIAAQIK